MGFPWGRSVGPLLFSGRLSCRSSALHSALSSYAVSEMRESDQVIEAEVVEIDGLPVAPRAVHEEKSRDTWRNWRGLQGRVMKLDSRWWPLWLLLGAVVLVLVVAIGMCVAVLFAFYLVVKYCLLALGSLLLPPAQPQRR